MTEFPVVLVINCGSSSIKFSVLDAASCDCLLNGVAEGINAERAFLSLNGGEPVALAQRGYEGALQAIAGALAQRDLIDSVALIGHRVAHGGDLFTESVIISEEVINNIRQVSSLAPLHNYASLSGIASAQRLFPLRFPRHLAPLCVPARPGAARVAGAGERPGDRPPGQWRLDLRGA